MSGSERAPVAIGSLAPVLTLGSARAFLLVLPAEKAPTSHPVSGVRLTSGARGERDAIVTMALRRAIGDETIRVVRRPSGRPALAPPHPEFGVSTSRRGRHLLVGFDPTGPVGVDLEVLGSGPTFEAARLAADHFSAAEAHAVAGRPAGEAHTLFLTFWVAKEAMLKASGRGVFDGMRQPDLANHVPTLLAWLDGGARNLCVLAELGVTLGRPALSDGVALMVGLACSPVKAESGT